MRVSLLHCLTNTPIDADEQLIELKQNPRAGDQRVRATLKTFKKNYHEDAFATTGGCRDAHGNFIGGPRSHVNLNERIKIMLDENVKQRSTLKEKTYELEALTYKYRKIQAIIQAGEYAQAINAANACTIDRPALPTSALVAPANALSPSQAPQPGGGAQQGQMLTSRSPTRERVSFSLNKPTLGDEPASSRPLSAEPAAAAAAKALASDSVFSKSPIMSSSGVTQITQITTTSSCQTADFTATTATSQLASSSTSETHARQRAAAAQLKHGTQQPTKRRAMFREPNGRFVGSRGSISSNLEAHNLVSTSFCSSSMKQASERVQQTTSSSFVALNDGDNIERQMLKLSEGPYCTLLLKNVIVAPGGAKRAAKQQHQQQQQAAQQSTRLSCPNLAAPSAHLAKPKHQQQRKQVSPAAALPRTLSMIEYLGLTELEQIAARHDELAQLAGRPRNKAATTPSPRNACARRGRIRPVQPAARACCYDSATSCHCACLSGGGAKRDAILSSSSSLVDRGGGGGGRQRLGTRANLNRCPLHSEPDVFSSEDPLNSTNTEPLALYSCSHVSCSTCCSLLSQSTMSQSHTDLYLDDASIQSSSTAASTSSHLLGGASSSSHSHTAASASIASSTSRTPSSSSSCVETNFGLSDITAERATPKTVVFGSTTSKTQEESSSFCTSGMMSCDDANEDARTRATSIKCDILERL